MERDNVAAGMDSSDARVTGTQSTSLAHRRDSLAALTARRYAQDMAQGSLVHIIDDDDAIRASLSSLVRSVGYDVRVYASTADFLAAPQRQTPACLLLDVRLPGTNGLDFQASLARHGISLPVILMTGYGDIEMSVRGMKAGAIDFLTKPLRHQDALDAISVAIARDVARRDAESSLLEVQRRFETLTPREMQVLDLVTAGRMNKQIATALGIAEITVKIHRGSVMKKMNARSLADLVRAAEALRRGGSLDRWNTPR